MTRHFMLRSFDHAGYYETRSLLAVLALSIAIYFWTKRRDARYLIMFASGVAFQAFLEWFLQSGGARGAGYNFSVFGATLSGIPGNLFQGLAEGGIFALMAFWFVDLRTQEPPDRPSRRGYLAVCALIIVLAVIVGILSAGKPITSPRPMATASGLTRIAITGAASLLLCAFRKNGLRYLGLFYIGLLIYTLITFEPLHILGARYIGVRGPSGAFEASPLGEQLLWMFYSHTVEVAFGKIHYFAVPFALFGMKSGDRRRK
jgi:hypothetical protein